MIEQMNRDPERDPALRAALRELAGEPLAPDFTALEARVAAAAELPLAARRRQGRAGRSLGLRALLPLAAAAGVAGAYLAMSPRQPALADQERLLVEQMVEASLPETVDQLLTGEAAQGALFEAVSGS